MSFVIDEDDFASAFNSEYDNNCWDNDCNISNYELQEIMSPSTDHWNYVYVTYFKTRITVDESK